MEAYPSDDISNITPHCLRHTFTTNGINSGVSLKNMQSLLGHANTKTLLETYLHIGYEDKRESISLIEKKSNLILNDISSSNDDINSNDMLKNKWSKVKRYKGNTKKAI